MRTFRDVTKEQIIALIKRRRWVSVRMAYLEMYIRDRKKINQSDFKEYHELNEELLKIRITEANATYIRNKL